MQQIWRQNRPFAVYVLLVVFAVLGSLAQRFLSVDPGPVAMILSPVMLISGCWAVFVESARQVGSKRAWAILLGVSVIGGGAELLGVFTGVPFGQYVYTDVWWPVLSLGTYGFYPLLIPLAWYLIVAGLFFALRNSTKQVWMAVIGTGLLSAIVDWPMESVMTNILGYWTWADGNPPIENFIGWCFVASLASILVAAVVNKSPRKPTISGFLPLTHLVFVISLAAIHGQIESCLIAAPILVVLWVVAYRGRFTKFVEP